MQELIEEALEKIGERVKEGKSTGVIPEKTEQDEKTLYTLGYTLYQSGDLEGGENVFRKLVAQFPMNRENWFGLASVLQVKRKFSHALVAWSMACLFDDEDPQPHYHAAECLLSLNDQEEALEALKASEMRIQSEHHPLRSKIATLMEAQHGNNS
ncbi:MAG: tetratricopeptide repeat protein [Simkaniaceae bacterium]|nr:tetratricopeptide repeat protein [Simkaniaceae bacterium]